MSRQSVEPLRGNETAKGSAKPTPKKAPKRSSSVKGDATKRAGSAHTDANIASGVPPRNLKDDDAAAPAPAARTSPSPWYGLSVLFGVIAYVAVGFSVPEESAGYVTHWHFNSVTKKSPFHKVLSKCCMAPGDGMVRAFHFISDSHDNNLKAAEEYARSMHKGATLITDVPNSVQAMHDKRIVRGGCNVVFVRVADKVDLTLAHHLKGMRDGQDEETLSLACTAFVFSSEGKERLTQVTPGTVRVPEAQKALRHFGPHDRLYNIFYTVLLPDFSR
eukprot:Rhum_TRINITY_DN14068_c0_g1::Rhum_TRINITY_DN14068_c0_g1_i1::g.68329::m.68329